LLSNYYYIVTISHALPSRIQCFSTISHSYTYNNRIKGEWNKDLKRSKETYGMMNQERYQVSKKIKDKMRFPTAAQISELEKTVMI
jgi:hypothetical protein